MNTLVSLLLAIAAGWIRKSERRKASLLFVFSTFVFAIMSSCGPPQMPTAPLITLAGGEQVHRQRETVSATIQPALAGKELLQIFVRADDNQWYPCAPAKQDLS